MGLIADGMVQEIVRTPRAVQIYVLRFDTASTNNIMLRVNDYSIQAIDNFLRNTAINKPPSTAVIEGWWMLPGQDAIAVQYYDSTFATVAANDQIPVLVN